MTETKNGSKAIYKGINIITTAMVAVLIIFAALLTLPKLAGLDTYVVLSGSMEPAYRTGSLIYTDKNMEPDELKIGDVITFKLSGETVAAHRIVGISTDSGSANLQAGETDNNARLFQTKGDANEYPDSKPVSEQDITGKVLFSIPYLGYAAEFVQHPPGIYVALAFGAVLLLLTFISDRRKA